MKISRSNRPGRRNAGSTASMRLVVPITMTASTRLRPSIKASSWVTVRVSEWAPVSPRLGAMASNSSMKMIEGE